MFWAYLMFRPSLVENSSLEDPHVWLSNANVTAFSRRRLLKDRVQPSRRRLSPANCMADREACEGCLERPIIFVAIPLGLGCKTLLNYVSKPRKRQVTPPFAPSTFPPFGILFLGTPHHRL